MLAHYAEADYNSNVSNLRTFLEEREKHLEAEVAKLRAILAPLERELFEVRVAQRAVGKKSPEPQQRHLFSNLKLNVDDEAAEVWRQYLEKGQAASDSPYFGLTIKDLITKALDEQFATGATANQLLELFRSAWGRPDVVRTSLSPQLSRLKDEGRIGREGTVWFLRRPRPASELPQAKKAATDQ